MIYHYSEMVGNFGFPCKGSIFGNEFPRLILKREKVMNTPPSGFNQNAINGLLVFVSEVYQGTLAKYDAGKPEIEFLEESAKHIEATVRIAARSLDGIVSEQAINGLATFCIENYKELVTEIHQGKKTSGYAMKAEIEHIARYLKDFHI